MNTLLDFDDTIPPPSQVALNHLEESSTDKTERCRPRKILDYAVLAKGQSEYCFYNSFTINFIRASHQFIM